MVGIHHPRRYYRNRTPPRRGDDWFFWVWSAVWESEAALANNVRRPVANHYELRSFSAQELGVCVFSRLILFLRVTAGLLLPFLTYNEALHRATVGLRHPAID